ncbi:membrane protein [Defluviimonas sp. 20V17]|uniref:Membrane protein n=1 Tax=Allgaiera indica TaxID=765699 RepID=A0AAN4UTN4_9RHOB|nr:DUF2127 domain-containing protein [Allgaiera indica]KDB05378.1 membrane protein [Defluviimonas sp. 20V17]GHE04198.1 membrane protein [Allgaiera indica]SDX51077.1 Uncharacterized membrane protein [Allgaiera indica]
MMATRAPRLPVGRLARWLHGSYLFGITMQAVIGATQLIAAIVLQVALHTDEITELAHWTSAMLASQRADPLAAALLRSVHDFTVHPHTFWSVYLFGHGLLNLGVAVALFARKRWAHPVSIVVLSLFIVYQMSDFFLTGAPVLILLSVFDLVVILLVWHEWLELHQRRAQG